MLRSRIKQGWIYGTRNGGSSLQLIKFFKSIIFSFSCYVFQTPPKLLSGYASQHATQQTSLDQIGWRLQWFRRALLTHKLSPIARAQLHTYRKNESNQTYNCQNVWIMPACLPADLMFEDLLRFTSEDHTSSLLKKASSTRKCYSVSTWSMLHVATILEVGELSPRPCPVPLVPESDEQENTLDCPVFRLNCNNETAPSDW